MLHKFPASAAPSPLAATQLLPLPSRFLTFVFFLNFHPQFPSLLVDPNSYLRETSIEISQLFAPPLPLPRKLSRSTFHMALLLKTRHSGCSDISIIIDFLKALAPLGTISLLYLSAYEFLVFSSCKQAHASPLKKKILPINPFPLTFTKQSYSIPSFQAYSTVSTFSLPIHSSIQTIWSPPFPCPWNYLVNIYTQVPQGQLKPNMSKTRLLISESKPSSLTILTSSAEGNAILPVAQAKKLRTLLFSFLSYPTSQSTRNSVVCIFKTDPNRIYPSTK